MVVSLDIEIDLGTKYLTNISAYFLGGIFAADEFAQKDGVRYVVSPTRYNKSSIDNKDFENHYQAVTKLAKVINKTTLLSPLIIANKLNTGKFNNRMFGFGTYFECANDLRLENEAAKVMTALEKSSSIVRRCFLVGMFDGRGYYDKHAGYIGFDCANEKLSKFLCDVINLYGLKCNYNPLRARKNKESKSRDPQIRINKIENFQENIGFISRQKINKYYDLYDKYLYVIAEENFVLEGLKIIRRK